METLQRFAVPMPDGGLETTVRVPALSDRDDTALRHVGVIDGALYVWFVVEPGPPAFRVPLRVLRDGDELVGYDFARYLGSGILPDGPVHVFLG